MEKSHWNRTRVVIIHEFRGFPFEMASIIAEYCAELKLREWIDPNKLVIESLFSNPNAGEAEILDWKNMPDLIALPRSTIPQIVKQLKFLKNTLKLVDVCWSNPVLVDIFLADPENEMWIMWKGLSACPSEQALQLLLANQDKIYWPEFSMNPFAIEWLRSHPEKIVMSHIDANCAATDIIFSKSTLDTHMLCYNPHSLAIEFLRNNQSGIHWGRFSQNPGIFEYRVDPQLLYQLIDQGTVY